MRGTFLYRKVEKGGRGGEGVRQGRRGEGWGRGGGYMFSYRSVLSPPPGAFTRHCLSEYKRLTFSQLLRLQSHWQSFVREPDHWEQPLGRKVGMGTGYGNEHGLFLIGMGTECRR